jgi:hypothetical protein
MNIKIDGIEPQFKIYKMTENVNNKIYIGSTYYPLKQRMSNHRTSQSKVDNYFSNMGWNNVFVEIIDYAIDSIEMKRKENEHIEKYRVSHADLLLNKNKAYTGLSILEYGRYSYANKKDYYKNYFMTKIVCDVCQSTFQRSSSTNHRKTKKHIRNFENKI